MNLSISIIQSNVNCVVFGKGLEDLEVQMEHITVLNELGSGNFSHVKLASVARLRTSQTSPTLVAAKFALPQSSHQDQRLLFNEARQMRQFVHDNVVRLLGVCFSASPCCLLLELMPNGDVKTYLRRWAQHSKSLDSRSHENQSQDSLQHVSVHHLLRISRDCSSGFAYLAGLRHIHRDLAARNIVLSSDFTAKIGDFG